MTDKDPKNGRFVKGNKASPGRPPKQSKQDYEDVFFEVIQIDRWRKMIEAQAKRAERGDIQAFNAIANRILPIITKNEHTGEYGEAIKIQIIDTTDANNND